MIKIHKPVGMTPLELLNKIRIQQPELKNEKLAFAGRLDPMAEGEMLILVGDECKNRKKYERLDKEYEFEILFGVSTDTYDILGKITNNVIATTPRRERDLLKRINNIIPSFIGKQLQPYPPYSSPRIKGKSLWWWAKEERLDEIEIPKKEIEIYDLVCLGIIEKQFKDLYMGITQKIGKVHGNFRQEEILKMWRQVFQENAESVTTVAKFKVCCSSGTYARSLSNEFEKYLGIPAVILSLKRTKIG